MSDQPRETPARQTTANAQRHLETGIAAAGRGDWTAAAEAFGRAATDAPAWPDGHHNLSIALTNLNDPGGALAAARKAASLTGAGSGVWLNLGNLAARANDLEAAENAFRAVLTLSHDNAGAHLNLGLVLCAQENWADAIEHLSTAHAATGKKTGTAVLLARALREAGDAKRALDLLPEPDSGTAHGVDVLYERARAYAALKDNTSALATTDRILALDPAQEKALMLKADLLAADEAWQDFDAFMAAALVRVPDSIELGTLFATRLIERRKTQEAVQVMQTLLRAHPNNCDVLVSLGTCYWENVDYAEALAQYEQALAINPQHRDAIHSLASLYYELNDFDNAAKFAGRAFALDPSSNRSVKTLSLAYLATGRLAEGWDLLEDPINDQRAAALSWIDPDKNWQEKDLNGKVLRIRPEQGVGDEIRFATCYPDAINDTKKCVIECDPRLHEIFARTYPDAEFVPVSLDDRLNGTFPEYPFDLECLAGSLPRRYRRSLDAFPDTPQVLQTDPALDEKWRTRLDALGPTFKIGLCWRSTVVDAPRMRRFFYTHTDDWQDLYALDGVSFINLFPNAAQHEIETVKNRFGVTLQQWDDLDLKDDIDDILSLINGLDLVVSIQAAVWTFAGALGKDALILLNPNVLMGSERVPWFPSIEPVTAMWTRPWPEVSADIAQRVRARMEKQAATASPPQSRQ